MKKIIPILLLLIAPLAFGFSKDDLAVNTLESSNRVYRVVGCYLEDGEQVCKLKGLEHFVHSTYLREFVFENSLCKFKKGDDVAVVFGTTRGPFSVVGLYVYEEGDCRYRLTDNDFFVNEEWLRRFE